MRERAGREPNFVSRDVARLSAFSDAVFAIALTLPVLEIRLPHAGAHFAAELRAMLPDLFVYLVTFSVGGSQWLTHYRLIGHIRRIDRRALYGNLWFLMVYSLLPLTTSLVMNSGGEPLARSVYSLNLSLLSLVLAGLSIYLDQHGYFDRPGIERYYRVRSLGVGGLFLAQALVALLAPDLWPWCFAAFPVIFAVLQRLGFLRPPAELDRDEVYVEGEEEAPEPVRRA